MILIHKEDRAIVHVYSPNSTEKNVNQRLIETIEGKDMGTIIDGDANYLFSSIDKQLERKISRK